MRSKGFPLSGHIIRSNAKTLCDDVLNLYEGQELGANRPFSALSFSADEAGARHCISKFESLVTEGEHDPRQVYNVVENRFYCKKSLI